MAADPKTYHDANAPMLERDYPFPFETTHPVTGEDLTHQDDDDDE